MSIEKKDEKDCLKRKTVQLFSVFCLHFVKNIQLHMRKFGSKLCSLRKKVDIEIVRWSMFKGILNLI